MLVNGTDSRRDFQFTVPPFVVIPAQLSSVRVPCMEKGKAREGKGKRKSGQRRETRRQECVTQGVCWFLSATVA